MKNDYINAQLEDPEIRQHICFIIANDPICRDIIIRSIYEDMNKLDIEKSSARNWRKLVSINIFVAGLILEELFKNAGEILNRIKSWTQ
jgi:hypothetical protein